MKYLLPLLALCVGCTTTNGEKPVKREEVKPTTPEKIEPAKKPTPPVIKKPGPKVQVKEEAEKEAVNAIDDKLLKRQLLFAVACEQHKVVKGLANQYQRNVISFTDNTPEIAAATKPKDLATITITYTLKAPTLTASSPSDAVKKPIAKVICTVNEGVDKAKPSYKVESLSLNGITLK